MPRRTPHPFCSLFFASSLLCACASQPNGDSSSAQTAAETSAQRAPEQASPAPPEREDALTRYTKDLPGDGPLRAVLETSEGRITCLLFPEQAPITVANFIGLARGLKSWTDPESLDTVPDRPYYDGVVFHRVFPGFVIHTGDRTGTGHGGPGYTIPDEIARDLKHDRPGVLSMANAGPNTGGAQFFITEAPAPHLDGRHTIFGQCEDLDVIKSIARAPTDAQNRPEHPPVLTTVRIVK
ncbi:MAG: peptidylprolyl isomerase [Myxococcota bacterium]